MGGGWNRRRHRRPADWRHHDLQPRTRNAPEQKNSARTAQAAAAGMRILAGARVRSPASMGVGGRHRKRIRLSGARPLPGRGGTRGPRMPPAPPLCGHMGRRLAAAPARLTSSALQAQAWCTSGLPADEGEEVWARRALVPPLRHVHAACRRARLKQGRQRSAPRRATRLSGRCASCRELEGKGSCVGRGRPEPSSVR